MDNRCRTPVKAKYIPSFCCYHYAVLMISHNRCLDIMLKSAFQVKIWPDIISVKWLDIQNQMIRNCLLSSWALCMKTTLWIPTCFCLWAYTCVSLHLEHNFYISASSLCIHECSSGLKVVLETFCLILFRTWRFSTKVTYYLSMTFINNAHNISLIMFLHFMPQHSVFALFEHNKVL